MLIVLSAYARTPAGSDTKKLKIIFTLFLPCSCFCQAKKQNCSIISKIFALLFAKKLPEVFPKTPYV
jgi:hypothetical protein